MRLLISLLILAGPAAAFAAERARVEAVTFLEGSVFVYEALDPACACQAGKCVYEDESGKSECTPRTTRTINLITDLVEVLKDAPSGPSQVKPKLETFPLKIEGDTIDVSLGPDCHRGYESFAAKDSRKPKCEILLVSQAKGKKQVAAISFSPSPGYSFRVLGFYRSPFESRIAIVVQQASRHFEEEMDTHQTVFGADLVKGFRK